MATVVWPLLVTIAGFAVWGFAKDKTMEAGKIAFFVGLFWLVHLLSTKTFHF